MMPSHCRPKWNPSESRTLRLPESSGGRDEMGERHSACKPWPPMPRRPLSSGPSKQTCLLVALFKPPVPQGQQVQ